MMNVTQNLHTHTTFCDGKNTPAEMAASAAALGMRSLGFSSHAYTPHDESYCMMLTNYEAYKAELDRLSQVYAGRLRIFTGLEQDYFSAEPTIKTDYIIGSVHYVKKCGEYIPVDETRAHIESAVSRLYGSDIYGFLEDYFALVSDIHNKTGCDIVGHIDLCEKFNADGSLFDRTHPRCIAAYTAAVEKLCAQGCIFEVNTGAISRGYTRLPYPYRDIMKCIAERSGKITLQSDSHSVDTVNYKLDEMCTYAAEHGFDERYELAENGKFEAIECTAQNAEQS